MPHRAADLGLRGRCVLPNIHREPRRRRRLFKAHPQSSRSTRGGRKAVGLAHLAAGGHRALALPVRTDGRGATSLPSATTPATATATSPAPVVRGGTQGGTRRAGTLRIRGALWRGETVQRVQPVPRRRAEAARTHALSRAWAVPVRGALLRGEEARRARPVLRRRAEAGRPHALPRAPQFAGRLPLRWRRRSGRATTRQAAASAAERAAAASPE
mmetsp:Transcript_19618/g.45892  ORF Transcript_19618/g.45892 Transcript_19618/m.45892 type:complete len:215 (+) Transcript_19618:137-781(+)